MNLVDLFDLSLIGRSERTALEYDSATGATKSLTFGEMEARSNGVANALTAAGFTKGDRLCIYLANSPSMIEIFLACLKLGVIFVPINILYREREVTHIVSDADPRAVIASAPLPGDMAYWNLDDLLAAAAKSGTERPRVSIDGDDAAAIIYTSGTTGTSKGAVLTHNNFASNASGLVTCWQFTERDRLLLALPLFHVHGLGNGLHCWLVSGCLMRLLERFEHQRAAVEFQDFQPTVFFGVPTMYIRLLDLSEVAASVIGQSVRLFVSGSAPLAAQVLEDFQRKFGHTILERYGMTETLMNTTNPYIGERRAGTVGLPMPGVSIQVRDRDGQLVEDGVEGELFVRGPNVFREYWRRPEATTAAMIDGYFRTGDIGVRSPDGYFTLKGRASDLIISGGFNIYPREIEEFLQDQPGVAEAAVAGVADRVRGEVPVAYLVCDEPLDTAALTSLCQATFASFKVPKAFVRVKALPRTALGKVQKHLLPSPG